MYGVSVDSRGKSGGFALLWRKSVDVLVQSFSRHHIYISVRLNETQVWWRFMGIHREPETCNRDITWNILSKLSKQSNRPWVCAGDFNEIIDQSEKAGGFSGEIFTWSNRHSFPDTVLERLDRACATLSWSQMFSSTQVTHVPMSCSDHQVLLIRLQSARSLSKGRFRPWRFEATWLQSEQCEGIVAEGWTALLNRTSPSGLQERVESCKTMLSSWSKKLGREDKQRVEKLEKRLALIMSGTPTRELHEEAS
ncbi:UNVERIFIED_CONTAM: hypothetical protein Sradi_6265600 [Sesamum radiatum]|uniref:Endonuclease/exonuclease/phosphatase domain-containing protein n=1 Tax=Sesamum radiatum TaxID=300843 RepID=A0AAW2KB02_SESRA